jgi:hypothetical protein
MSLTLHLLRPGRVLVAAVLFLLSLAGARPAVAQETRAEVIAQEEAEKAKSLKPEGPSTAEQRFLKWRRELLEEPSGLYPYFDSVYSGGGFTLGAGYRDYYGDNTFWDLRGLYSFKNYKFIELSTTSLNLAEDRLDLRGYVGWRDATQVAFYGLGINSDADAKSNFRLKQTYVGGELKFNPIPWVVLGGGLTYEDYRREEGTGSSPSIEEIYTPSTAPGLFSEPSYLHSRASAGIDWRPAAGYARRGGLYEVSYHNYADTDDTFSFDKVDVDLVQHIPILREDWVLSLHGAVETTLDDDDVVPFFLLPSLGSGSTLRGFPSWRFRDRHSLLVQAEWRWIVNRTGLDMALFYDAGKVTSRRSDLDFDGLKSDVGIGVRFHGPAATPLRIELAHGNEGFNLVFAGSAAF